MNATLLTADALIRPDSPTREIQSQQPFSTPKPVELPLSAVATLVLWLACAGVGAAGLAFSYNRPQPAKAEVAPVQFTKLNVELTNTPLPQPDVAMPASALSAPPPPSAVAQPSLPQPIAVAELSSAVAFAIPVEGPVRVINAAQASLGRSSMNSAASVPSSGQVQTLVFGQGEGRQPAPSYPPHAVRLGQEGTVTVQLSVDQTGRVISAEASQPSPWPLLNDAAIRTVRERWRFASGAIRNFEVAINFRLRK